MKKKTAVLLLILISVVACIVLIQTEIIYLSHTAAVNDTLVNLLAKNEQALPRQTVDLAMLDQHPDVPLNKIAQWEAQNIEVENTIPLFRSMLDDDPIYRLEADLHITFTDGSKATLVWESWRYGLVMGPAVISLGNGPPGYITAVSER